MAEGTGRESSPDTDGDFDPSAEMLANEFDDERTLEEEEAMSSSSDVGQELNELEREGEMPLEQLLAMYGYGPEARGINDIGKEPLEQEESASSTAERSETNESSNDGQPQLRTLMNDPYTEEDDEDDDYEESEDELSWKKTIQVGGDYQAVVPEWRWPVQPPYADTPSYEGEDRLLWDPRALDESEVESYLRQCGCISGDDEQALFQLHQCGHRVEEALRRKKMQSVRPAEPLQLWSEEECDAFEEGLRIYGKNFVALQANKFRSRSVADLVQFYYLWKKTPRHDAFEAQSRNRRLQVPTLSLSLPGQPDYLERFVEEQASALLQAVASEKPEPPMSLLQTHREMLAQ